MGTLFDVEGWRQVIVSALTELGTTVASFLPKFLGALVILLVGWVLAKLVEVAARRLLAGVGIDRAAERLALSQTLVEAGIRSSPSRILGRLAFWLLMLTFVLSAFDTLGLTAVTGTIDRLIGYLPNVIAAALIVLVGLLLARFVGNLVGSGAAAGGVDYARQLGSAARGATVAMVGILALEQLGVETDVLVTGATALVAAVALGVAFSFALGARPIVEAILAGHYLRLSLPSGERLEVDGRAGVLERVGATETIFRDGPRTWSVPNARLLQEVVVRTGEH